MTSLYVSLTSFFASKVDESIGASYMALLWTITNMSGLICDTGAMWLTGKFEEFSGYISKWDAYHYVLALLTIIRLEFKISFENYFYRFQHWMVRMLHITDCLFTEIKERRMEYQYTKTRLI